MGDMATNEELQGWFAGRLTAGWFSGPPEVRTDREEILVVGDLADVELGKDATDATRSAARESRVDAFREETREARMAIADDAQQRFRKVVSWAVRVGGEEYPFTTLALPVMTRLRMKGRRTLDTLVAAGVARSRAEALAWCVKLVAEHEADWIAGLQEALQGVEKKRAEGPRLN
ncbi:MAG: hypothetical protein ACHQ15_05275 [Candidatus Limnocylindrales bacterium]